MSGLLAGFSPWHWLVAAVALMIAETLLPGALLLWFGAGAAATGALLWLLPDLGWQLQWVFFGVVSAASILGARRWRVRHPEATSHPTLNRRGMSYVGRRFTLGEPIVDGYGKLHVDDTAWRVSGEDLPAGTHVKVTGVDGTVLEVTRDDGR
jgi:membrane protein implicated in regulation of membrane protease activity